MRSAPHRMILQGVRRVWVDKVSHAVAVPVVLAVVSLAVGLAGNQGASVLRYTRADIARGDWWRLLTGQFVHLSWNHLVLNLVGLIVVWLLVGERLGAWAWSVAFLVSGLGVALGLWLFSPEIQWYVGLSGALHGLLVLGAVRALVERDWLGAALLVIVAGKLGYEQLTGPSQDVEQLIAGSVVIDAHLYGALTGLLLGIVWSAARSFRAGEAATPPR